jgi:hypothetical protein
VKSHAPAFIWRHCWSVAKLAGINLWKCGSFSYWFDNLGFPTERRLAAVLIIPSSWGSQRGVIYTPSVAIWITCKKWEVPVLLKTIPFLQFQRAQIKAHTPTRIRALVYFSTPFSKCLNIFITLVGGGISKVNWTTLQIRRAKGHAKKRWLIDSHKTHIPYNQSNYA